MSGGPLEWAAGVLGLAGEDLVIDVDLAAESACDRAARHDERLHERDLRRESCTPPSRSGADCERVDDGIREVDCEFAGRW